MHKRTHTQAAASNKEIVEKCAAIGVRICRYEATFILGNKNTGYELCRAFLSNRTRRSARTVPIVNVVRRKLLVTSPETTALITIVNFMSSFNVEIWFFSLSVCVRVSVSRSFVFHSII